MKTYQNILNEYVEQLQHLAETLEHSTENIKLFALAEEMKRKKIIVGYKLVNYAPGSHKTLKLEKYDDDYYNTIIEE